MWQFSYKMFILSYDCLLIVYDETNVNRKGVGFGRFYKKIVNIRVYSMLLLCNILYNFITK